MVAGVLKGRSRKERWAEHQLQATWWNKGQEKEDQGMKVQKVPNDCMHDGPGSQLETNDFSSRQDTLESCQETDARVTDKDEAEDSMA